MTTTELRKVIETKLVQVDQKSANEIDNLDAHWKWCGSTIDTSEHRGIKLDFNGCNLGSSSNPRIIHEACDAIGVCFLTAITSAKRPVYSGYVVDVVEVLSELMALDPHPLFLMGTQEAIYADRNLKCVIQVKPGMGSIVLPFGVSVPDLWLKLSI